MYEVARSYLRTIHELYDTGNATELSYYPPLASLIKSVAKSAFNTDVIVVQNPKKVLQGEEVIGLPDFVIKSKNGDIIGYMEAKDPIKINLNDILDTDQVHRYKQLPNWILTNFLDFMHFREKDNIKSTSLAKKEPLIARMIPKPEKLDAFKAMIEEFLSFSIKYSYTAEELATELAKRTQILKHVTNEEIEEYSNLRDIYEAFSKDLVKDLTRDDFADIYAQTIAYGLFFARMEAKESHFCRENAYTFIPPAIPILRNLFYFLTGPNLPTSLEFIVDDMVEVLRKTEINNIKKQFHTRLWTEDPVIHFYETFLKVYDPEMQDERGVFYTPAPVVSYIVKSLHEILKKHFNLKEGFADRTLTFLDPAAGTMSFPNTVIRLCATEYQSRGKEGLFNTLIKEHILKNFYAFELLVAPYAIGHFKINNLLKDLGYHPSPKDRFKLYLTNALEIKEIGETPLLPYLSEENNAANNVKQETKVLVICGNPPYSVSSQNKAQFIEKIMEDYKEDVRTERNIQPLSDDYIKFIRFAHWKIDQTGSGVFGMITNNSFLDGLIHRGMRKNLLRSFDIVYIFNLHGSSRRSENVPEGKKDQNVFDIQQGVCISIFIKLQSRTNQPKIFYADLWGTRNEKYSFLQDHSVYDLDWTQIVPKDPNYYFIPKSEDAEVTNYLSLSQIFLKKSTGVKTHRDKLALSRSKESLKSNLKMLTSLSQDNPDESILEEFKIKKSNDWKLDAARDELRYEGIIEHKIRKYNYRPFDIRWIYYSNILVTRPRGELVEDISDDNIALVTTRQLSSLPYNHVFVTNELPDICLVSLLTKESTYAFPLYYRSKGSLEWDKLIPNLNSILLSALREHYSSDIEPINIFHYIYAILYSHKYRSKMESLLLIDFPKIPFTSEKIYFKKLSDYGKQLVDLHLGLTRRDTVIAKFSTIGSNIVEEVTYSESQSRVYINDSQYFSSLKPDVWNYKIGSYQVLRKLLRDKMNQELIIDDIENFQNIVITINETIRIQQEIDNIYEDAMNHILSINLKENQELIPS
jgi:type I restriction-modification system DNA methylase subunit